MVDANADQANAIRYRAINRKAALSDRLVQLLSGVQESPIGDQILDE